MGVKIGKKVLISSKIAIEYRRLTRDVGHMCGREDMRVMLIHISPIFTLFWGSTEAKLMIKMGKNVAIFG